MALFGCVKQPKIEVVISSSPPKDSSKSTSVSRGPGDKRISIRSSKSTARQLQYDTKRREKEKKKETPADLPGLD